MTMKIDGTPDVTDVTPSAPQNVQEFERSEIEARSAPAWSEELTPEELAYFNSRGENVAGLGVSDAPAPAPERFDPAPAPVPPAPAPAPVTAEAPRAPVTPDSAPVVPTPAPAAVGAVGENEDVDLDTLTVDSQGVMRDPQGRFVPHSALHRAREKFKAARASADAAAAENRRLMEQIATLSGRFEQLSALMQPAAPAAAPTAPAPEPEDVAPDVNTDIFGYVAWQSRQLEKANKSIAELRAQSQEQVESVRGQLTEQGMMNHYRNDAQAFVAQKPEFGDAYRHLVNARNAELALMGYDDANQRMQIIQNEERELVAMAHKRRQRPAEFIYNVSVARGFRAPAAAVPAPVAAVPAPIAAAPAAPLPTPVAAPAAPAPTATPAAITAAQQLANQAAARAAAGTLSGAGGGSGDGLTVDAIASMSDAEFAALHAKLGMRGMRQFLGG